MDHISGHKTSLHKFKKTEIISKYLFSYNGMKVEISGKRETEKFTNIWKLNNMLLNNQ